MSRVNGDSESLAARITPESSIFDLERFKIAPLPLDGMCYLWQAEHDVEPQCDQRAGVAGFGVHATLPAPVVPTLAGRHALERSR